MLALSGNEILPCGQDEIPLRGTKSTLRVVEICRRSLQTMKPRNLFGFGASFTLAAIYSRSLLQQAQASAELRSSVDGSRDGVRALPIYGPLNG